MQFLKIYRKHRAYTAENKLVDLLEILGNFHIDEKVLEKAKETGELSNNPQSFVELDYLNTKDFNIQKR
jgi:hypothetical protein